MLWQSKLCRNNLAKNIRNSNSSDSQAWQAWAANAWQQWTLPVPELSFRFQFPSYLEKGGNAVVRLSAQIFSGARKAGATPPESNLPFACSGILGNTCRVWVSTRDCELWAIDSESEGKRWHAPPPQKQKGWPSSKLLACTLVAEEKKRGRLRAHYSSRRMLAWHASFAALHSRTSTTSTSSTSSSSSDTNITTTC
jgi:hypothetical protein